MDEFKSEEKLNEDPYILEQRKFYLELRDSKRDNIRNEIKDRILKLNGEFNKNLVEDQKPVQTVTWEDIIDTVGYTIERNKLFQELKDYTIYHGTRKIIPMQPCLCKVFQLKEHKKNYNIKSIERIVKLILSLKSEHICKLIGAIEVKQTEKMYFFEELTKMPLCNYFKNTEKALDLIKAKTWLIQIASGILYLHNHGLVHQKVNLESVYLKDGGIIKLGCPDALGEQVSYDVIKAVSKFIELSRPLKKNQFSSYEQLYGDSKIYDGMSSDVWSLGVLLYYFLTLKYPFNNWKIKKEMSIEIQCKRWSFIGMMDTNPPLDEDTKTFLSKIFVSSPEARLTIHEIIIDSYLFKKTNEEPPLPLPISAPVLATPQVRNEQEKEFDWVQNERQAQIQQLKNFLNQYTNNYRYKRFQTFQLQVNGHQLTNKEFDRANYEEGVEKEVKILRTNLIYEANEIQLYEAQLRDEHCLVKIELLNEFLKRNQIKNLSLHLKMLLELKDVDKFIQLIKCYTIGNKIYLFINADKNLNRLSCKFLEDHPIQTQLARSWVRQLIDALHYLHSKGLALRCLDPEYIFIKNNNLIIDQIENIYSIFSFDDTQGRQTQYPTRNLIKTPYSSPESIYNENTFDPFSADIFSLAVIMYHLLFLRTPFEIKSKKIFLEQIEQKRWLHLFDKKYKLDNDFFSFFDSIFVENPDARPLTIELIFSNVYRGENNHQ